MVDITHIFWLYLGTYNSKQNRKTRLVPTGWETCDQPALCDQIIILTSLFLPVEYLQKVKGLWKKPCWQLVYLASLVCTSLLVVKCPLTPQELFLILTVTVFTFFFDCTERAIYIIHDFKCITLQNLTLSEIKCVKILNTYDTQPKISLRISYFISISKIYPLEIPSLRTSCILNQIFNIIPSFTL